MHHQVKVTRLTKTHKEINQTHPTTHRAGDINAEYHHGALVALATGGCCCWSRVDHVSDVRISRNLVFSDVNYVTFVAELTTPDLQNQHKHIV